MRVFAAISRFNKLWAALLGTGLLTVHSFLDNGVFTDLEKVQTLSAVVGAFLVWLTANGPKGTVWRYAKTIAFGVSAVLTVLVTTLPDGLTAQEKIDLLIAFGTGIGILSVSNKDTAPNDVPETVVTH